MNAQVGGWKFKQKQDVADIVLTKWRLLTSLVSKTYLCYLIPDMRQWDGKQFEVFPAPQIYNLKLPGDSIRQT